jgi:phosphoribosylanthranilate isomerase
VKLCGIVRAEDAAAAGRLGADYLGAIFAGGPRLVPPAVVRANVAAAREAATAPGPLAVGVMGTQPPDEIAHLAEAATLDAVQLHADPDAEAVAAVRRAFPGEVWAVLRIAGTAIPARAAGLFQAADAVVLDAMVAWTPYGGTGVTLEWEALAESLAPYRGPARLVLAGGLRPENVAGAVRALRPDVVDVSSGVERAPGVKDPDRMAAFLAAARSATSSR